MNMPSLLFTRIIRPLDPRQRRAHVVPRLRERVSRVPRFVKRAARQEHGDWDDGRQRRRARDDGVDDGTFNFVVFLFVFGDVETR